MFALSQHCISCNVYIPDPRAQRPESKTGNVRHAVTLRRHVVHSALRDWAAFKAKNTPPWGSAGALQTQHILRCLLHSMSFHGTFRAMYYYLDALAACGLGGFYALGWPIPKAGSK
ncbi:hypothetical protein LY78DRAFT_447012 [Colletotrichum sublineola]|nr:hypothetical protein LY78DRAFT_447012 [Colletotrichum sublineola]